MKNKYLEEALPVGGSSSTRFLVELRPHISSYLGDKDTEGAIENAWGGDSAYERGRDARRKFWIEPLKETYLGVAQAFLSPKRDYVIGYIFIFFRVRP